VLIARRKNEADNDDESEDDSNLFAWTRFTDATVVFIRLKGGLLVILLAG
jgi:hypothetical protein